MRAFSSSKVFSVSSCFGISTPASRATAPLAVSQAICTWRAARTCPGYRRERGQHLLVDLLRLGMRLRLVEDRRQVLQRVGEARRARLVHGNAHGGSFCGGFCGPFILSHRGGTPWKSRGQKRSTARPSRSNSSRPPASPRRRRRAQFFAENDKARPYLFMRDKMYLLLDGEVDLVGARRSSAPSARARSSARWPRSRMRRAARARWRRPPAASSRSTTSSSTTACRRSPPSR